jgi:hypothetical protein
MTTLTADDAMVAILSRAEGLAEVRDASGRVIGFYAPVAVKHADRYARAAATVDRAELERRKREAGPGIPLEDSLARLKKLEAEMNRRKEAGEKAFTTEEALAYCRALREQAMGSAEPRPANGPSEAPGCATR